MASPRPAYQQESSVFGSSGRRLIEACCWLPTCTGESPFGHSPGRGQHDIHRSKTGTEDIEKLSTYDTPEYGLSLHYLAIIEDGY